MNQSIFSFCLSITLSKRIQLVRQRSMWTRIANQGQFRISRVRFSSCRILFSSRQEKMRNVEQKRCGLEKKSVKTCINYDTRNYVSYVSRLALFT